ANERGIESNQRLEFLGDSVLSFVIAGYIYKEFKNMDEGRLTEMRAAVVCEKALAKAARMMDLGSGIAFGKSEQKCGGSDKDSILADAYESVLAAIYLDGGIEPARVWVMNSLSGAIEELKNMDFTNYKSEIQSYFQKRDKNREVVRYNLSGKTGPDHEPTFNVEATYLGRIIGRGEGKSRKAAEQEAAKIALSKVKHTQVV
ncbi:MAG: ribonuclease III, partial [Oscillospiraceae bacterium]